MQALKLFLLVWMFSLFYRPVSGTRAWSFYAAYDSRREALKATESFGQGGRYEFRIAPVWSSSTETISASGGMQF